MARLVAVVLTALLLGAWTHGRFPPVGYDSKIDGSGALAYDPAGQPIIVGIP